MFTGPPRTIPARDRWAAFAGIASVVLLIPALMVTVVAGDQPAPNAQTQRIVSYLTQHRNAYLSSLLFEIVSLALLLWFIAAFVDLAARSDPQVEWIGGLAFSGAIGFSVLMLIEDAAFAAAARLADQRDLGPTIRALWELGYQAAWPFTRGFLTLLLVGTGVAVWRTRALPRRVAATAWFAAIVNVAFLPTIFVRNGAFQAGGVLAHTTATLVFELWVLYAAMMMLVRRARPSSASAL